MEADTARRKPSETQRKPMRPSIGQRRAKLTANSFPQEFHQGGTVKMKLWASQWASVWVEREVEFSKTSEAKQSKVRVTWMHEPGALRPWMGQKKGASQRRWQLNWAQTRTMRNQNVKCWRR